jgi:hypothetical protein
LKSVEEEPPAIETWLIVAESLLSRVPGGLVQSSCGWPA